MLPIEGFFLGFSKTSAPQMITQWRAHLVGALWIALLTVVSSSSSQDEVVKELRSIRETINNQTQAFCYHAHSGSRNAYVSNQYRQFTKDHNVLIYPFCLTTNELGNRLGNYFYEVTCAEASGLHFMAVHPQWELMGSLQGNNLSNDTVNDMKRKQLAFLKALPDVVAHPKPLDRPQATSSIQNLCKCTRYCWQNKAPWVNHTESIGKYVQHAAKAYLAELSSENDAYTTIEPDDLTNAKKGDKLPLIPDATIHYRCGDNIAFNYMYGILPFTVIDSRISGNIKYIYVLSDHPSRAMSSPYTSRCKTILEKLYEYLIKKYPQSIIVIKRGGDIFLDFARIALSKTVICSASSYCFWPAVSNAVSNHNSVYFPLTYLIAGADSIDLAPSFGEYFHWITDAQIITSFKGLKPWTLIFDILEGKMQYPA